MWIEFSTSKLKKQCEETKLTTRTWGPTNAKIIRRRIEQIRAADTLEVLRTLPGARCHPLHHDQRDSGQLISFTPRDSYSYRLVTVRLYT